MAKKYCFEEIVRLVTELSMVPVAINLYILGVLSIELEVDIVARIDSTVHHRIRIIKKKTVIMYYRGINFETLICVIFYKYAVI